MRYFCLFFFCISLTLYGSEDLKEKIVLEMHKHRILKTNVTLSNGQVAPIYFDLRDVFSFPELSAHVSKAYQITAEGLEFDHICGAPLAGIPLATKLHEHLNAPLLLLRDAPKKHGTKKMLEGRYEEGSRTLLVDDVLFSGNAIIKSVDKLLEQGVVVEDAVVLIDKRAGGEQLVQVQHPQVRVHSFMTQDEIKQILEKHGLFVEGIARPVMERYNFPVMALHEFYTLEKMDPKHREGKFLVSCYEAFKRQEELLGKEWTYTDRFWNWLEVKKGADSPKVTYLKRQRERDPLKLEIQEGVLVINSENSRAFGKSKLMWVMDSSGQFYVAAKDRFGSDGEGLFQHSSFFAGESVSAAGNLILNAGGVLEKIDNYSGHYRTKGLQFANALSVLKDKGVNLENVEVSTFHDDKVMINRDGRIFALDWMERYQSRFDKKSARYTHLHEVPSDLIEALRSKVQDPKPSLYHDLYGAGSGVPGLDLFVKSTSQNPVLRQEMLLALQLGDESFYPNFYSSEKERFTRLRYLPLVWGPRIRCHFLNFVTSSLQLNSSKVEGMLAADPEWDIVVIGGGVHGSLLANKVTSENPRAKVLVVDKEELPSGHFHHGGQFFRINNTLFEPDDGPSFQRTAKYNVPHTYGPVQSTDLTGHRWPAAKVLAEIGRITLFSSQCDCLFNKKVVAIEKGSEGGYRVVTAAADSIRAKKVVFASGLGTPRLPTEDRASNKLLKKCLHKEECTENDRILSVEQSFRITPSISPLSVWHSESDVDVVLVGFGNSALTFLEFLYSLGPDVGYSYDSIQSKTPIRSVVLTGSSIEDVSVKGLKKKLRARYGDIISPVKEGKAKLIPSRMTRVEQLRDGRVKVYFDGVDGGESSLITNRLVLATGYESQVPTIIRNGGLDFTTEWVSGFVANSSKKVPFARKITGEEIYIVGPAAGRDIVDIHHNISGVPITQPGQVDAVSFTSVLTEALGSNLAKEAGSSSFDYEVAAHQVEGSAYFTEGASAPLVSREERPAFVSKFITDTTSVR